MSHGSLRTVMLACMRMTPSSPTSGATYRVSSDNPAGSVPLVMENVSGLVKGKMRVIFSEILRELKASGYKVSARLMNAMYFGVPQSRERMIFIGVREDLCS